MLRRQYCLGAESLAVSKKKLMRTFNVWKCPIKVFNADGVDGPRYGHKSGGVQQAQSNMARLLLQ